MADSEQNDRDALIAAAQVGIALQLRLRLQQSPSRVVRLRPVFSENAAANLTGLRQVVQTPLHRNADIASLAGRSVTVDQFHDRLFLLAGKHHLTVKPLQSLLHRRQIGLEVYGFNGSALGFFARRSRDLARIAPALINPTTEAAGERVGFFDVLLIDNSPD
jgi:hypothetical protein